MGAPHRRPQLSGISLTGLPPCPLLPPLFSPPVLQPGPVSWCGCCGAGSLGNWGFEHQVFPAIATIMRTGWAEPFPPASQVPWGGTRPSLQPRVRGEASGLTSICPESAFLPHSHPSHQGKDMNPPLNFIFEIPWLFLEGLCCFMKY